MSFSSDEKKAWYQTYMIPKRSGGFRKIEAPKEDLKKDQRTILNTLKPLYSASDFCYGGVIGKNIEQAARIHVPNKFKLKMDLHDFFGSVTGEAVEKQLLRNKELDAETIKNITYICTNSKGVLPQGAPTSPFLANVVAYPMVTAIGKMCTNLKVAFSIYVDDMIFSSNDIDTLMKAKKITEKIISRYGFSIKDKKTVLMRNKQEILGLCAKPLFSDHPRLTRKSRYRLKGQLHSFEKKIDENGSYGIDKSYWRKLCGMVAFANMANDQYAGRFNAAVARINEKMKGHKNNGH